MNFYSFLDLKNDSSQIWEDVRQNGEVVITDNGKPSALLVNIPDGQFEFVLRAVRSGLFIETLNQTRALNEKLGFLSEEEIEAEILATREEMRGKTSSSHL